MASSSSSLGLAPSSRRQCLQDVSTLDDVVTLLQKSKRIIVVSGAGISVSAGIPDFRSRDIGLYNTLDCAKFGIPSAELLFDIEFFRIDPDPFYRFANLLLPSKQVKPTLCHKFLYLLQTRRKLLRNYTQNIDGLERKAGITNLIECHGHMNTFHCIKCNRKRKLDEVIEDVRNGMVCYCRCKEIMKPAVTFFGEQLPKILFSTMIKDMPKCDLLLVIGTSLKVGGSVHEVLKGLDQSVPQILINRDPVQLPESISEGFDVSILGQCDDIAEYLCSQLGWLDLLGKHIAENSNPILNGKTDDDLKENSSSSKMESPATVEDEILVCNSGNKRKRIQDENELEAMTAVSSAKWICRKNEERKFTVQRDTAQHDTVRSCLNDQSDVV
jgi:NAD-dependent SIR2 family protein deacetylase